MKNPYFIVSKNKLIFMSIISHGIYVFYWFYKNWEVIDKNTNKNISPLFRALFSFLTSFWLFKQFNISASENGITQKLNCGLLAVGYFIILFSGYAPFPFNFIPIFAFIIVVKANSFAMKVNEKENPDFNISSKYTDLNWVLIIVGIIVWSLSLIFFIYPDFLLSGP